MTGTYWNADADTPCERPAECPICGADEERYCDLRKHALYESEMESDAMTARQNAASRESGPEALPTQEAAR